MITALRIFAILVVIASGIAMISFGLFSNWHASYGISLCEQRHNWFDSECLYHTFDLANLWLDRMFMTVPAIFIASFFAIIIFGFTNK